MCEIFDPSTPRSEKVVCAGSTEKNYSKDRKRGYEVPVERNHLGQILKKERGPAKKKDQIHGQVGIKKHPIIHRENICNYNLFHLLRVIEYHYLRHLYVNQMWWRKWSRSFCIWNYQYEMNQYHRTSLAWTIQDPVRIWELWIYKSQSQSSTPTWCLNFSYLKVLGNVNPFNISGVEGVT